MFALGLLFQNVGVILLALDPSLTSTMEIKPSNLTKADQSILLEETRAEKRSALLF